MVTIERSVIPDVGYQRVGSAARVEVIDLAVFRSTVAKLAAFDAPQRPAFDLLIMPTEGNLEHRVDFEAYDVRAGELLWVHAGQIQQWGDLGGVEGSLVLFLPEILTPLSVDELHESGAWTHQLWRQGEYTANVPVAVTMLQHLNDARTAAAALAAERLLEALLLLLIDGSSFGLAKPCTPLYDRFLRMLDARGSVHRSVEAFAEALQCTPKTLTLAVRERSGRTAKQAIDERLMLEAKRLLIFRRDEPIRAIAEALGFDDTANFSKFFKRHAQVTPGVWRAGFSLDSST